MRAVGIPAAVYEQSVAILALDSCQIVHALRRLLNGRAPLDNVRDQHFTFPAEMVL